jgi:RNA polymerase sigma-70 factor (family 1)
MSAIFLNEVSLLKSLKKGEPLAYSFLVDTYHHKFCVYAYSLTNNHTLSEDIVQNVFIKIWTMRHELKDDLNLKNYLYKSIHNEFINQFRKQKKVLTLEKKHIEALSFILDEEGEEELEQLINLVKIEIDNLPTKCKQTFSLSKHEGLTNAEIADYLNISTKSVEGHITKAFSLLRRTLGNKLNHILFLFFNVSLFGLRKKEPIIK